MTSSAAIGRRALPIARQAVGPRAGQALVEFGFTMLMLSVLLVGVVDFARIFYYDVITSAAANAGVRAAAAGADDATVGAAVETSAPASVGPSLVVRVRPDEGARKAGPTPVWTTVTVTYSFQPLTPLASSLAGSSLVLITRSASQRVRTACCR
jgi:TadE-like protein